jgi:hypothetical protein
MSARVQVLGGIASALLNVAELLTAVYCFVDTPHALIKIFGGFFLAGLATAAGLVKFSNFSTGNPWVWLFTYLAVHPIAAVACVIYLEAFYLDPNWVQISAGMTQYFFVVAGIQLVFIIIMASFIDEVGRCCKNKQV